MKQLALALMVLGLGACNWTVIVSRNADGEQGNHFVSRPVISADGRYVAFDSRADNFVPGDTNAVDDVFWKDVVSGEIRRVSVDSGGVESNDASVFSSMSRDGRYVAFASIASNLVPGDTNDATDVFVHDVIAGQTTRVSVDSGGNQADGHSAGPKISADGRYVAFTSDAANLVAGDTNGLTGDPVDVFVHDRNLGVTTRVSVMTGGGQATGGSYLPWISGDGRFVAFHSFADDLIAGDANAAADVFVHDRHSVTTTLVSRSSAGDQGNAVSWHGAVSDDGRYVAFLSAATNLVPYDSNGVGDIFVFDRIEQTTTRANLSSEGAQADASAFPAGISPDGRYVLFTSDANLVADDTNFSLGDHFVRDLQAGATYRVSEGPLGEQASLGIGSSSGGDLAISADGRYIVFGASSPDLVEGDTNGTTDIYLKSFPIMSVTSVVPHMLPIGATTSITIHGANFLAGATPWLNGAQKDNIVVVDENTITLDVTVPAGKPAGARDIGVNLSGTGAGNNTGSTAVCEDCVTFF